MVSSQRLGIKLKYGAKSFMLKIDFDQTKNDNFDKFRQTLLDRIGNESVGLAWKGGTAFSRDLAIIYFSTFSDSDGVLLEIENEADLICAIEENGNGSSFWIYVTGRGHQCTIYYSSTAPCAN